MAHIISISSEHLFKFSVIHFWMSLAVLAAVPERFHQFLHLLGRVAQQAFYLIYIVDEGEADNIQSLGVSVKRKLVFSKSCGSLGAE